MNKLVSIITPTFNRIELIKETLESVKKQTYLNWECIIVDDGSTLDTLSCITTYIEKDKRFTLYKRPENKKKGPSSCRNYGLEKAKGEYVVFLDSDDLLVTSCIYNRVKEMENDKEMDFIVFSMGLFEISNDLKIDEKRKFFNGTNQETIKEFLKSKYPWNTSRPIYKTSIVKKINGFNENLMILEDPELALRMLLTIPSVKYKSLDITDSYYRVDSALRDKYKNREYVHRIMENLMIFYKDLPVTEKQVEIHRKDFICFFIGISIGYSHYINFSYYKQLMNKLDVFLDLTFIEKNKLRLYFVLKKNENKRGTYKLIQLLKRSFYN